MSYLSQVAISFNKHLKMHKFKCFLQVEVQSVSDYDLRKKKSLWLYMPRKYRAKLPAIRLYAREEVGCQRHAPTSSPPGKKSGAHFKGAGWTERSVRLRPENLAPAGFEPWTTQSVASRCTGWAIPTSQLRSVLNIHLYVLILTNFMH